MPSSLTPSSKLALIKHLPARGNFTPKRLPLVALCTPAPLLLPDPWFEVGFVFTTGINSAYVLGYFETIMSLLGWVFGVLGLIVASASSLYANSLISKLHEFGGKRHIRYRDLAGYIYGNYAAMCVRLDLFLAQFEDKMTPDDVYLSFLTLACIHDRMLEEYFFHNGASVGYYYGA